MEPGRPHTALASGNCSSPSTPGGRELEAAMSFCTDGMPGSFAQGMAKNQKVNLLIARDFLKSLGVACKDVRSR